MVPSSTIKAELGHIIDTMMGQAGVPVPTKYMQTAHIVAQWLDDVTISIEIDTAKPLPIPNEPEVYHG